MQTAAKSFWALTLLGALACSSTTQHTKSEAGAPPEAAPTKAKPAREPGKSKPHDKPKPKPKPESKPKPKPPAGEPHAEKPRPAPQSDQSQLVVPIRVALSALAQQIDALVPATDQTDWTQITKGDESPRAEVKVQVWRDPIKLTFSDRAFHIEVPVHYAANVRAWVKNPFKKRDWISIAKNESWGTRDEPQHITATIDAEVGIDEAWHIETKTHLRDLEHGDPPSGKICKNAGIKICMSKEDVAPKVRKGIDAYLEPRLKKALAGVDAEVQRTLDLEARARTVWTALQKPALLPLPGSQPPTWLTVQPTAAGIAQPRMDGADLRVDVSLSGRIAVRSGNKPELAPAPLPKLSNVTEPPGIHVNAELRVPREALSTELDRALRGLALGGKAVPKLSIASAEVQLHADAKHPRRLQVKLALAGATRDTIEGYADLEYDAGAQRLAIERFELTPASEALLHDKFEDLDLAALRKQIARKARWNLGGQSAQLDRAIATALNANLRDQVRVSGELTQFELKRFSVERDALVADVIIGGAFDVAYLPR